MSQHNELGKSKLGLFLLFSLVLLILIHPQLNESLFSRLVLIFLISLPLIVAAVKISDKRGPVWTFVALIAGASTCAIAGHILANRTLLAIHWAVLAVLFGVAIVKLFSYLRHAAAVTADHLFTAASVYLLLAGLRYNLYDVIETIQPASFQQTVTTATHTRADLLYFSLVTLTTMGYGDIVPVGGEVRLLAALEAVVGVLYVAITVAVLVSAYRRQSAENGEK
jgi:hypothetical protein